MGPNSLMVVYVDPLGKTVFCTTVKKEAIILLNETRLMCGVV